MEDVKVVMSKILLTGLANGMAYFMVGSKVVIPFHIIAYTPLCTRAEGGSYDGKGTDHWRLTSRISFA